MTPGKARASRTIGLEAEAAIERHFVRLGDEILARNHHSREGELDLVARRGDLILIVEVKARREHALVDPLASVTPSKQRKIVRAALDFVQKNGLDHLSIRFDVVAVTLFRQPNRAPEIEHIEAAFDASAADEGSATFR